MANLMLPKRGCPIRRTAVGHGSFIGQSQNGKRAGVAGWLRLGVKSTLSTIMDQMNSQNIMQKINGRSAVARPYAHPENLVSE
jgi:hypothetical protein